MRAFTKKREAPNPEGSASWVITPDGYWCIMYFGGMLAGTWKQTDASHILFSPYYVPERFVVYGTQQKNLGDSIKVYFKNCEDVATYIGFSNNKKQIPVLRRVFNPSPNCTDWPNIFTFPPTVTDTLLLSTTVISHEKNNRYITFAITNPNHYNSFVVHQYIPKQEHKSFYVPLVNNTLQFANSHYGHFKQRSGLEDLNNEDSLLIQSLKNMGNLIKDTVFYNDGYKEFFSSSLRLDEEIGIPVDTFNYRFETLLNAFVHKTVTNVTELNTPREEGTFEDYRMVRYYKRLQPVSLTEQPVTRNEKPLFYFTCPEKE